MRPTLLCRKAVRAYLAVVNGGVTGQFGNAESRDQVSVLRQFAHELLAPSGTPSWDYFAIESGLASYFPCSFTDHPMVGDKASDAGKAILPPQDLRKRRKFAEIQLSKWDSVQNVNKSTAPVAWMQAAHEKPCWEVAGISKSAIAERRRIEQETLSQVQSVYDVTAKRLCEACSRALPL